MEVFNVDVRVGFGVPEDGDIIFHIHFTRPEGLAWVASYSYGQLCSLDNFVSYNCDKIKHVPFPVLSRHRTKTLMKLLSSEDFQVEKTVELLRLKDLIEQWLHTVLLRLHVMSISVHNRVQKFLYLPHGPVSKDNGIIIPGTIEQYGSVTKKHTKGLFGFNNKKKEEDIDDGYEELVQAETEVETKSPPLLKVNVRRGREGKHGKLEYEIQIFYSKDSRDAPHCIFRRYSEFAALFNSLKSIEGDNFLFTTFPIPPAKCSIGMGLDETELSIRTRQLDAWFRDCFYNFCKFKSQSKALIREFLRLVVHSQEEVRETIATSRPTTAGSSSSASMYARNEDEEEKAAKIAFMIQKGLALGLVEGSRAVLFDFSSTFSPSSASKSQSPGTSLSASAAGTSATRPAATEEEDDASVLSGESRVSGASVLSHNAKIKKKRKTIINSMWETMSSISKNSGGKDKEDSAVTAAVTTQGPAAVPVRPRMTKYVVGNAIVSAANPIFKWDSGNLSFSAGNHTALSSVEEGDTEASQQRQSVAVAAMNGAAAAGEDCAQGTLVPNLASYQLFRAKKFSERHTVIIRFARYNKKLLSLLAESAQSATDD